MRKALLILIAVAFAAMPAWAFHDGGVAACNGCHTMHNSQDGGLVDVDSPNGNEWLLVDATPSDVCLGCHADHLGAVLGDDPLAPPRLIGAGNFVFLLEDNINDGHAGGDFTDVNGDGIFDPGEDTWTNAISGDAAGHNVNAPGHGLYADGMLGTSPGGSFPASVLGCTSCHDPHGNTNFRMLYGAGRVIQDGVASFTNDAPVAEGLGIFGGAPEHNANHTAYQSGMSAWCGNCHGNFHNSGAYVHPSGTNLSGGTQTTYNLYNGTEDQLGAVQASAYLAMVPIEDPAQTTTSVAGATSNSQVMCLTCHRAHASSAADAGRWDFQVTLMHEDGEESGSYQIPDPYASTNQRSLCNKCHNKDEFDAIH